MPASEVRDRARGSRRGRGRLHHRGRGERDRPGAGARHEAPRAGARAHPRARGRDPDADPDRPLDAVRAPVRRARMRVLDLSQPLDERTVLWPGSTPFAAPRTGRLRRGRVLVARPAHARARRHAPRRARPLRAGRRDGGRHPRRPARPPGGADRRPRAVRRRPGVDAGGGATWTAWEAEHGPRAGGLRGAALHRLGRVPPRGPRALRRRPARVPRATGRPRRGCSSSAAWRASGSTRWASTPARRPRTRCTTSRCPPGLWHLEGLIGLDALPPTGATLVVGALRAARRVGHAGPRARAHPLSRKLSRQMSSCTAPRSATDVRHRVDELLRRGARVRRDRVDEPREADVDRLAAALDQAVGVEQEAAARRERRTPPRRAARRAASRRAASTARPSKNAGARPAPAPAAAGARRPRSARGRSRARRPRRRASRSARPRPGRRTCRGARAAPPGHPRAGERAHGAPQLPHRARGGDAAPDDVADADRHAAVRQRERVVPVAADLEMLHRGAVGGRDLVARVGRQRPRQQARLQRAARRPAASSSSRTRSSASAVCSAQRGSERALVRRELRGPANASRAARGRPAPTAQRAAPPASPASNPAGPANASGASAPSTAGPGRSAAALAPRDAGPARAEVRPSARPRPRPPPPGRSAPRRARP